MPDFDNNLILLSEGHVRGGLPYRVERSRYYRQQFLDLVSALRIMRIEGSQPYDEFVNRRLSATYDFIHMVGLKYTRVQQTITALNRQISARRLLDLQEDISNWAAAIGKLQKSAEKGFWAVLFPYYASMLLLHIMVGEQNLGKFNRWLDKVMGTDVHEHHDLAQLYISFILLMWGIDKSLEHGLRRRIRKAIRDAAMAVRRTVASVVQKFSDFRKYSDEIMRRKADKISAAYERRKNIAQTWKDHQLARLKGETATKAKSLKSLKEKYWARRGGRQ